MTRSNKWIQWHLSSLVQRRSRDDVRARDWLILLWTYELLKISPYFFIFKNSEKVFRIDIGSCSFQESIITYLSPPRKSLKTQLQLLLPLNFAHTKKVLEKRLIFVLFLGGTKFIQKINSISKYRPRLMKLSETHQDISELVWKKFGWGNFIPSWSKFCEHVLFSLIFGMNGNWAGFEMTELIANA